MIIKLWKDFSKRKNSTKQPADSSAVTLTVTLKDGTSIESPEFILASDDFTYNYCQAFGHYYFIKDIKSVNKGLIQISCEQDLLATYKSNILNTTAFVSYSNSLFSPHIKDDRVVSLNSSTIRTISGATAFFDTTGYFVLTVAGTSTYHSPGFAKSYILTASELFGLSNDLMGTISDDILEDIAKRVLSPFDSIISCKWLPFDRTTAITKGYSTDNIVLGNYGTGRSGYLASDSSPMTAVTALNISAILSAIDDFAKVSPFTRMNATIPYYGTIDVPVMPFVKDEVVTFDYGIDYITGDVTCRIETNDNKEIISSINYNVAVDCPVGQTTTNFGSFLTSLGSFATNMALSTVNPISLVGAAASVANSAMETTAPKQSVKGSLGGRSGTRYGTDTVLTFETLDTTSPEPLQAVCGRPYMQVTSLAAMSGYVKCEDASVNMAGLADDKQTINAFLNSGIFLE